MNEFSINNNNNTFMMDLFAGCGGLSTGFEYAGFKPVLTCELNDDARSSYLVNRFNNVGNVKFSDATNLHFKDIHEIKGKKIDEIIQYLNQNEPSINLKKSKNSNLAVIAGGPPCQGYSRIGHRRSYNVDKNSLPSNKLYIKMAETIETFRPKVFIFENVAGILSGKWNPEGNKGEIWNDVKRRFRSISDYTVRWSLLKSKDYEVPQNRPRVIMVGVRNDILTRSSLNPENDLEDAVKCNFLPSPSKNPPPHLDDLLSDLIDHSIHPILMNQNYPRRFETTEYQHPPLNMIQQYLRTNLNGKQLQKGSTLEEQEYSKHRPSIIQKFNQMILNGGIIPHQHKTKKFAQRLLPQFWSNLGPSITATSLPDDYVHFAQPRILTVREWARLQMFPDWYTFMGKRTTGGLRRAGNPQIGDFDREVPKYTQIGNAVPVKLAELIGNHLFNEVIN